MKKYYIIALLLAVVSVNTTQNLRAFDPLTTGGCCLFCCAPAILFTTAVGGLTIAKSCKAKINIYKRQTEELVLIAKELALLEQKEQTEGLSEVEKARRERLSNNARGILNKHYLPSTDPKVLRKIMRAKQISPKFWRFVCGTVGGLSLLTFLLPCIILGGCALCGGATICAAAADN